MQLSGLMLLPLVLRPWVSKHISWAHFGIIGANFVVVESRVTAFELLDIEVLGMFMAADKFSATYFSKA